MIDGISDAAKYSLVAGAVADGGLTVIANEPNPAGVTLLRRGFADESIGALAQSRQDKQPLSVLVFDQKHLRELSSIFEAEVARQMVDKLTKTLEQMAAPKGLVIRTEVTTFTVLLPGFLPKYGSGRSRAGVGQKLLH